MRVWELRKALEQFAPNADVALEYDGTVCAIEKVVKEGDLVVMWHDYNMDSYDLYHKRYPHAL